ncbi:hypothetical protein cypCar_00034013 [Cyprinus carpio]|nr:hypothetical protein cypCar_00034013 [Cyprinus carpio]
MCVLERSVVRNPCNCAVTRCESSSMSLSVNRMPSAGSRRRPAAPSSTRHSHGDSSVRSSYSTASCKCTESNTVPLSNPATPQ